MGGKGLRFPTRDGTVDGLAGPMQVLPCEKTYRHDWWACPFVHPGESAKRRDPRKFKYSAVACPNAKQVGNPLSSHAK